MRNNENKRVDITYVWKYARTMLAGLCDEIRYRCIRTFLNNGGFGFPREIDSARTIEQITVVFCNTQVRNATIRERVSFSWHKFLMDEVSVNIDIELQYLFLALPNIQFGMSK